MNPQNTVKFTNENGKINIICDSDTPLGMIHDFLLNIKGHIVDRMVTAQKEEQEVSDKMKENEEKDGE